MAIKIDLKKAYDHIEWDFLDEVLRKAGFYGLMMQLIMNCTSQVSLFVVWNGCS